MYSDSKSGDMSYSSVASVCVHSFCVYRSEAGDSAVAFTGESTGDLSRGERESTGDRMGDRKRDILSMTPSSRRGAPSLCLGVRGSQLWVVCTPVRKAGQGVVGFGQKRWVERGEKCVSGGGGIGDGKTRGGERKGTVG
jgi:hypothetical protein